MDKVEVIKTPYGTVYDFLVKFNNVEKCEEILQIIEKLEVMGIVRGGKYFNVNKDSWVKLIFRGGDESLDKTMLYGLGFKWVRVRDYEFGVNVNNRLYVLENKFRELPTLIKGTYHACGVYVFGNHGLHLVKQRIKKGYNIVTGGFERSEINPTQCTKRELKEEMGIEEDDIGCIKPLYSTKTTIGNQFDDDDKIPSVFNISCVFLKPTSKIANRVGTIRLNDDEIECITVFNGTTDRGIIERKLKQSYFEVKKLGTRYGAKLLGSREDCDLIIKCLEPLITKSRK